MTTRAGSRSPALAGYAALAALSLLVTALDVARSRHSPPPGAEAAGGADVLLLVGGATLLAGAVAAVMPSSARARVLVGLSVALGAVGLVGPVVLGPVVDPGSLLGPALRLAIAAAVCGLAIAATLGGRGTG